MLKLMQKNNRSLVLKLIILLLIVNIFFVFTKSKLIEHDHCSEEHCPICEVIYIVKNNLSNLAFGGKVLKVFLVYTLFSLINKPKNSIVKKVTLVECKVRLDC